MSKMKIAALAVAAVVAMTLGAEAGQKKHNFGFKPHHGFGAHYDACWWEYSSVPKYVFHKVRIVHNGKVRWKNVRKVRYQRERQYVCDYAY